MIKVPISTVPSLYDFCSNRISQGFLPDRGRNPWGPPISSQESNPRRVSALYQPTSRCVTDSQKPQQKSTVVH